MPVPRPYEIDRPHAVQMSLQPYSIRGDRPRHRGRSWRHIAAGLLTAVLVLAGVLVATVTMTAAASEPSRAAPDHQAELRQDARDQIDRSAER